ncbi:MAG: radical SAM protein [Candidatus Omnitrophota bacterium]
MIKHYTIPFFILHKGCPCQCVFCNQKKITGQEIPSPRDIPEKIERYLATMPRGEAEVEAGFFGGTFTGLPRDTQEALLKPVEPYIKKGLISGIRLSTRPDLIDHDVLAFLREKGVSCIELGVQSMSDRVLNASKRGHSALDTENASRMIVRHGFRLCHQIMCALPLSTFEDECFTAVEAARLGASQARIYPVLVIRGTELEALYKRKEYTPLTEEEAVERCAMLLVYFGSMGISVIRCGLHPSEGLINGNDLVAGPFHPAFRMKAESRVFGMMLRYARENPPGTIEEIAYNPSDEAAFYGFGKANAPEIKKIFGKNTPLVKSDGSILKNSLRFTGTGGVIVADRKIMAKMILPEGMR